MDKGCGMVSIGQSMIQAVTTVYSLKYQYKMLKEQGAVRKQELQVEQKRLENELKVAEMNFRLELEKIEDGNQARVQQYMDGIIHKCLDMNRPVADITVLIEAFRHNANQVNRSIRY